MRKHRLGKQLLIVLCVVLIVFLAGCRPSPVLEQIIYEQNHEVDPDTETKTMNDDLENEEPDENIPSRETVDDSEQTKGEALTAALAGDSDTSDDVDAVYDVVYTPSGDLSEPDEANPTEGSASEKATGSTEAGGEEGGSVSSGEEGDEPGTEGASGEEAQGGESGDAEQQDGGNGDLDDGAESGDGYSPGESTEPKRVTDAAGREIELPENVGTVTAVGEVATIVEMLGGNNRLLASSSSFFENDLAQQAFASQGAGSVYCWWDGDGSSTECYNLSALVEAHPDVCFEISGQNTFTNEQLTTLDESGIIYVVLWPLDSITNIQNDVTLVGQVLGNNADYGVNSESIASDYNNWTNNVINQSSGGSAKATAYIGRWERQAHWKIYRSSGILAEADGAPVGMGSSGAFKDCLDQVNVTNTCVNNYFVEPLYTIYWGPDITRTETARYNVAVNSLYSDDLGVYLGNAAFPALIVADSSIRDEILNWDYGTYGYYHWRIGEYVSVESGSGRVWAYGFDDGTGTGNLLSTHIAGEYDVLVNPDGLGSWMNGSVETPLEVAWLGCKFQNNVSLDQVRSWVDEFYSTFYHYNVNNSYILGE